MYDLFAAGDRLSRAHLQTNLAAGAFLRNHPIDNQGATSLGRAALFLDMRLILVPEVANRREHRIGRGLAEAAERAALDGFGQLGQELECHRRAPFPG